MVTKSVTDDGSGRDRNSRTCRHTIDQHLAGKCTECGRDADERQDERESRVDHKLVLGPHGQGGVVDESWVGIS